MSPIPFGVLCTAIFAAGYLCSEFRDRMWPLIAPVDITVYYNEDGSKTLSMTQKGAPLGWVKLSPEVQAALIEQLERRPDAIEYLFKRTVP